MRSVFASSTQELKDADDALVEGGDVTTEGQLGDEIWIGSGTESSAQCRCLSISRRRVAIGHGWLTVIPMNPSDSVFLNHMPSHPSNLITPFMAITGSIRWQLQAQAQ